MAIVDTPLTQLEQLFQNIDIGPHLPKMRAPDVCCIGWDDLAWARHFGLETVEQYHWLMRVEARHERSRNYG